MALSCSTTDSLCSLIALIQILEMDNCTVFYVVYLAATHKMVGEVVIVDAAPLSAAYGCAESENDNHAGRWV